MNMSTQPLQRVKQKLVQEDAVSSLRAGILESVFKPGERLIETELAQQLGVSRGPVRDALKELAREGLVVIQPYRGAIVATFSADDVRQIYELRSLLEGYATRRAVEKVTTADIDRLQEIYSEMKACARAGNVTGLVEKDVEFHRELCRLSGNSRLLTAWSSLIAQVRLFLTLAGGVFYDPEFIVETHTPVLEAMRRRDADDAERAIKESMRETAQTIMRGMEEERASAE
jgi:DNA-binding GntR family transcriptional regulator